MSAAMYISVTIAFVVTTTLIFIITPVARTLGLVDIPNERKQHQGQVPLVGGLAIFVAVVTTHIVAHRLHPMGALTIDYVSFYAAAALLVMVGLIDDFRELSPSVRLASQIFATLVIIFSAGTVVRDFGTMSVDGQVLELGWFAVPFTVVAVVGVINAVNMSDGLDGLAGSLSLIPILGFIVATLVLGDGREAVVLCVFAASIIGFLVFNVTVPGKRRALIFLGDSGSMFLGLSLAWMTIRLSQGEHQVISPAAALWFVMLPIFDAVAMMLRRILRKREPFAADREHLHHIFLLAGFTVTETVVTMSCIATIGVIIGLSGTYFGVSDLVLAGTFLVLGLLYFWMIVRAWTVMRFLRRSICRRREMIDRRNHGDRRRDSGSLPAGRERRKGSDRRHSPRRQFGGTNKPFRDA